jgi:hypothetical protein
MVRDEIHLNSWTREYRCWVLLRKIGIKADQWWFIQTTGVANLLLCPDLVPCHVGVVDVVRHNCGRSRVCVSVINFRDLPHTCACTRCCIQNKKDGNKRGSTGSRTREPYFISTQKMQELTPSPNQGKIRHGRSLLEILTYLPHTWSSHCWATQLKCVKFKLPFITVPSLGITMVL